MRQRLGSWLLVGAALVATGWCSPRAAVGAPAAEAPKRPFFPCAVWFYYKGFVPGEPGEPGEAAAYLDKIFATVSELGMNTVVAVG